MPRAKAPMKNRVVRVDDATWEAAIRKADARGENVSDVIREALRRYARRPD